MKRILLVDDEPNLRLLIRTTLRSPDVEIHEAVDGIQGLQLARELRPDLLILDWMMPGLSGIEVARHLHEDADMAAIPILMLTARGQDADRAQAIQNGVQAYLVKPFRPLELLDRVSDILAQ